jgi:hypothetical protein
MVIIVSLCIGNVVIAIAMMWLTPICLHDSLYVITCLSLELNCYDPAMTRFIIVKSVRRGVNTFCCDCCGMQRVVAFAADPALLLLLC